MPEQPGVDLGRLQHGARRPVRERLLGDGRRRRRLPRVIGDASLDGSRNESALRRGDPRAQGAVTRASLSGRLGQRRRPSRRSRPGRAWPCRSIRHRGRPGGCPCVIGIGVEQDGGSPCCHPGVVNGARAGDRATAVSSQSAIAASPAALPSSRASFQTLTVCVPRATRLRAARSPSWPDTGTLPARPWAASAATTPPAMPSFSDEHRMDSLLFAVRNCSMLVWALAGSQLSV